MFSRFMTRFFSSLAPFNRPKSSRKLLFVSWYMIYSNSYITSLRQQISQHQLHFLYWTVVNHWLVDDLNGLVYYSRQDPKWFIETANGQQIINLHHSTHPHQATKPIVIFQGLRRHCISHDLVKLHDLWRERTLVKNFWDLRIKYE